MLGKRKRSLRSRSYSEQALFQTRKAGRICSSEAAFWGKQRLVITFQELEPERSMPRSTSGRSSRDLAEHGAAFSKRKIGALLSSAGCGGFVRLGIVGFIGRLKGIMQFGELRLRLRP